MGRRCRPCVFYSALHRIRTSRPEVNTGIIQLVRWTFTPRMDMRAACATIASYALNAAWMNWLRTPNFIESCRRAWPSEKLSQPPPTPME